MRVIQKTGSDPRGGCRGGPNLLDLALDLAKIRLLAPIEIVQVPLQSLLGDYEGLVRTGRSAKIRTVVVQVGGDGWPRGWLVTPKWCLGLGDGSDHHHEAGEHETNAKYLRGHFYKFASS